jgi:putative effector of murein hydrolase LrgA (UPF0299 family)
LGVYPSLKACILGVMLLVLLLAKQRVGMEEAEEKAESKLGGIRVLLVALPVLAAAIACSVR